jgi:hypothetical protein
VPPKVLAAARALMCILCIVIIGFSASESISAGQSFGRWLSFLTNWTWVLCLFVLFPALGVSLYFIKASPPAALQPSLYMRVHWIMWEMAGAATAPLPHSCPPPTPLSAALSLTITILFWALVYKPNGSAVRFSVGHAASNMSPTLGAISSPFLVCFKSL